MSWHRYRNLWVAALLPFVVAACGGNETPAGEEDYRTVVTVATARTGELRDVANASGTIVPSRTADLTVYAAENSEIAELPKKEGDEVAVGDVLVRFDIPSLTQELASMQLTVLEAESRLDRAKAELTRQSSLYERGITSRNAYDASRLEESAAETGLAAARARLEALQASDTRSIVRASFSGTVAAVWHEEGDLVRPDTSDPILRVVDPTRVQVAVHLPIAQLARIVPGQIATVRAIAAAVDETATVVSKAQMVDPGSPTGEVRLAFDTAATLPLDTPVSVEILLARRSDALLVPSQAVGRDDLGVFLMIAGEDGLAHRRDARTGLVTTELTEITSGLEEGERVILLGTDAIEDQTPIVISR